jgi:hypothetical protein
MIGVTVPVSAAGVQTAGRGVNTPPEQAMLAVPAQIIAAALTHPCLEIF